MIENGQSLKLHQMQQAKGITSTSTKLTINKRHPDTPSKVVPGRDRNGDREENRWEKEWQQQGCQVTRWATPSPPASCWQMHCPSATSMSLTHTHHLPASPYSTVSHSMPKTEPWTLSFGFGALVFGTGIPWVGILNTVPIPVYTIPVLVTVLYKTRSVTITCSILIIKIIKINITVTI